MVRNIQNKIHYFWQGNNDSVYILSHRDSNSFLAFCVSFYGFVFTLSICTSTYNPLLFLWIFLSFQRAYLFFCILERISKVKTLGQLSHIQRHYFFRVLRLLFPFPSTKINMPGSQWMFLNKYLRDYTRFVYCFSGV